MHKLANIARIAMWIMIGMILLGFFIKGSWIRIVWIIAAVICLVCVLIIGYNKNRGR